MALTTTKEEKKQQQQQRRRGRRTETSSSRSSWSSSTATATMNSSRRSAISTVVWMTMMTMIYLFSCSDERSFVAVVSGFTSSSSSSWTRNTFSSSASSASLSTTALYSSFYDKFEDFDEDEDDDEDDDDDEYSELDERSIADFKSKMSNMFEDSSVGGDASSVSDGSSQQQSTVSSVDDLINFARSQQESSSGTQQDVDWAKPVQVEDANTMTIRPGMVLIANPRQFCEMEESSSASSVSGEEGDSATSSGGGPLDRMFKMAMGGGGDGNGDNDIGPNPTLLAKFGLTRPPPRSLGADRQADLLPVVIIVETDESTGLAQGVLLNRRTGYLLGDLEQPPSPDDDEDSPPPILEKFCIQPLWWAGTDNVSTGLDMLHLCPTVEGSQQITDDGMYWGGDPAQAQDALDTSVGGRAFTGFDFKFFVQSTIWSQNDLKKEIGGDVWFCADVAKNVLFKSRDRMGTKKAKP
eukprot:CAMPEP_0113509774 /NCGR_PEP_ID=MMETSP0014_2-20120614/37760_1 /TAXON_ID=2857 /ORGANISM="Nitzschia sp." /LENGTH=466 /DNA_ID=CAMNT_0000405637 /DNA_START=118 /DNA_END=1515 /DNA_ORIENTATION=+ /assembly_acc=CAM_ASM_000159